MSGSTWQHGVTVVTVTRDRPEFLLRAAKSVFAQEPKDLFVKHVIIGVECSQLNQWRDDYFDDLANPKDCRTLVCENVSRTPASAAASISARCAALRMEAVRRHANTDFVAFLDDDNVLLPQHLTSLMSCADMAPAVDLAYSHRLMFHNDGHLFRGDFFPWAVNDELQSNGLKVMTQGGIMVEESPVVFDTHLWDESSGYSGTVDTNEWLMRRSLLDSIPWPSDVTEREQQNGIFEDGKFLRWPSDSVGAATLLLRCRAERSALRASPSSWRDAALSSESPASQLRRKPS
ncbi:unnamed protein product [Symbiodinium natans]|uniref:Glycosyltransferase 2-like domain-containing protein n=1 Tax=Symbiodinium natans TaxID=878477 RepID=A0A812JNJ8_9DINO|nr:unnamed protein product [Symbiodinium natans]